MAVRREARPARPRWETPTGTLCRLFRGFYPQDRIDEQCGVQTKARCDACTEAAETEAEPVHGGKSCSHADDQTRRIRVHGRNAAAEALADEEQSEAESKAHVNRPDDPQIQRAVTRHLGI